MHSANDLSVTRTAGACRATLEVERRWLPWSGRLDGRLILEGREKPQKLLACDVTLFTQIPESGDTPTITDHRRWERRTVQPQERVELPFSLKMGWGSPGFGQIGGIRATVTTVAGFFGWPHRLYLPLDVNPPGEFVRIAATLADMADMELGLWKVVSSGDGAEMRVTSRDREAPLSEIRLRLFRSPGRVYGELQTEARPRGGRVIGERRKIPVRFERDDPDEIRRVLRACLEPMLTGTETMPIPASPLEAVRDDLPLPAEPRPPGARDLPRPADLDGSSLG